MILKVNFDSLLYCCPKRPKIRENNKPSCISLTIWTDRQTSSTALHRHWVDA